MQTTSEVLSFHASVSILFLSVCVRQTFANGQLRLEGKQLEGRGKCPFDPFQRFSSLMVGECLPWGTKAQKQTLLNV